MTLSISTDHISTLLLFLGMSYNVSYERLVWNRTFFGVQSLPMTSMIVMVRMVLEEARFTNLCLYLSPAWLYAMKCNIRCNCGQGPLVVTSDHPMSTQWSPRGWWSPWDHTDQIRQVSCALPLKPREPIFKSYAKFWEDHESNIFLASNKKHFEVKLSPCVVTGQYEYVVTGHTL